MKATICRIPRIEITDLLNAFSEATGKDYEEIEQVFFECDIYPQNGFNPSFSIKNKIRVTKENCPFWLEQAFKELFQDNDLEELIIIED
jgi:hypothetical protein